MNSYDEVEKKKKDRGLFWLFLWLFILFSIFLPPKIQTVSIYRLVCPDVLSIEQTCPALPVPTISTYRVFIEQQYVISRGTLTAYKECTVFDRKNWECRTPQLTISMKNGRELFLPQPTGYSTTQAYNEAVETLANEEKRNPQVPIWIWAYNYAQYWIRSF